LLEPTAKTSSYCTVSVNADVVFWVGPSVAVTVRGYDPGTVVGVIVTVAVAVLVESAWEVAVTVTLPGSFAAAVGAVYTPPEEIDPQGFGVPVHDTVLVKVQFTAVLLVLLTVGVNVAV
jgi:hypothetical protein